MLSFIITFIFILFLMLAVDEAVFNNNYDYPRKDSWVYYILEGLIVLCLTLATYEWFGDMAVKLIMYFK